MTRKDFIKSSALFAGAVSAPSILKAEGAKRVFKVGIVGCGGRGNGAQTGSPDVRDNTFRSYHDGQLSGLSHTGRHL